MAGRVRGGHWILITHHPNVMDEDAMRQRLDEAITTAGGLRAFAKRVGVNHSVIGNALKGGPVGPAILTALGLTRTVTYRPIAPPFCSTCGGEPAENEKGRIVGLRHKEGCTG